MAGMHEMRVTFTHLPHSKSPLTDLREMNIESTYFPKEVSYLFCCSWLLAFLRNSGNKKEDKE